MNMIYQKIKTDQKIIYLYQTLMILISIKKNNQKFLYKAKKAN
jgi:hypothetical protein